jgi:type I restriction enzyme S subunit
VREILRSIAPDCEVWAFGSRVHGRGLKPFSDLDLVVKSPGDGVGRRCAALRGAFEESSLPFRVDVIEWASLDDEFRDLIERERLVVQTPQHPAAPEA